VKLAPALRGSLRNLGDGRTGSVCLLLTANHPGGGSDVPVAGAKRQPPGR